MLEYTVSELNTAVSDHISQKFNTLFKVTGEVSDFKTYQSGHSYFGLKDDDSRISAVLFRGNRSSLSFIPKSGDKVNVIGSLSTYVPRGEYQLVVREIQYAAEGDIWLRFQQVKTKLEAEGIISSQKREVAEYPKSIVILTSDQGAALTDMMTAFQKSHGLFDIDLIHINVQGESATGSILSALDKVNKSTKDYDALVLSRGGGSVEDLATFNDETIARALAASRVPTISAIGHERDIVITDFVADYRAATPTAAAQYLCRGYVSAFERLNSSMKSLSNSMDYLLNINFQRIDRVEPQNWSNSPTDLIEKKRMQTQHSIRQLVTMTLSTLEKGNHRIDNSMLKIKNNTLDTIKTKAVISSIISDIGYSLAGRIQSLYGNLSKLDRRICHPEVIYRSSAMEAKAGSLTIEINKTMQEQLANSRNRLEKAMSVLEYSQVSKALDSGFLLLLQNGKQIGKLKDVDPDKDIKLRFADGEAVAKLTVMMPYSSIDQQ